MRSIFSFIPLLFLSINAFGQCITGTITPSSMYFCPDGAIDITLTCGIAPYTYLWSNNATTQDISGIKNGQYTVTVTDALCGTATQTFSVGYNSNNIYIAGKVNLDNCGHYEAYGTGSIDLYVPPGGTYTYHWSGPNGFTASTQDLTNLSQPGDYLVTVTNALGCSVERYENICCCTLDPDPNNSSWVPPASWRCSTGSGWNSPPITNLSGVVHSPSTPTSGDGSIDVSVAGGGSDKYYTWTGPNGFSAHTQDLVGLSVPGNYCVTVQDGCSSANKCFVVVICSQSTLTINGSIRNTCSGYSTGSVTTSVTGGIAPYSYIWNNNQTTPSLSGLPTGQYCVTVTDLAGCSTTKCFTVANGTLSRDGCNILCDGNIIQTLEEKLVYQSDCRYAQRQCSDGYPLGPVEYLGLLPPEVVGCTLNSYCKNGKLFSSYTGTSCRDCILFNDFGYIVCCHVNYCWFPSLGVSYVTGINEHQSVTSIQIGDGDCNVEVWDDCSQPIQKIYDRDHPCNSIPYHDGNCYEYFNIGDFVEGAFGYCSGFAPEDPTLSTSARKEILDQLKINKFSIENNFGIAEVTRKNANQITVKEGDPCSDLTISFPSEKEGIANLHFFNSKMKIIGQYKVEVIKGINNVTLKNFMFGTDSIVAIVSLPDQSEMKKRIVSQCQKGNYNNDGIRRLPISESITIFPNPTNHDIAINLELKQAEMVTFEILNTLGEMFYQKSEQCTKGYNSISINLSTYPTGTYIISIKDENGLLKSERIIKE